MIYSSLLTLFASYSHQTPIGTLHPPSCPEKNAEHQELHIQTQNDFRSNKVATIKCRLVPIPWVYRKGENNSR